LVAAANDGRRLTLSCSSSVSTPPAPSTSSCPNCGSTEIPTRTSATASPTISSTSSVPESALRRCAARLASWGERTLSTTPPTSLLCSSAGEAAFITTGKPSAVAASAASRACTTGERALGLGLREAVRADARRLRHTQLDVPTVMPALAHRAGEVERLERLALSLQRHDAGGEAALAGRR